MDFDSMDPEQLKILQGLMYPHAAKTSALAEQLRQAQALQSGSNEYATGPGATTGSALFGGLANAMRTIRGGMDSKRIRGEQEQEFQNTGRDAGTMYGLRRAMAGDQAKQLAAQRLADTAATNSEWDRRHPTTGGQKSEEELSYLQAKADYLSAQAAGMGHDPTKSLKTENLKLQNKKLERSLNNAATKEGAGKQLPAATLDELAGIDTATKQLDGLLETFTRTNQGGISGKAGGALTRALGLQGTSAAEYEGAASSVRQGVGKILEGGKLAAGDEVKYKNMLPKPGDSADVVKQKVQSLKAYLSQLKSDRLTTLKAGGYAVPGGGAAPAASGLTPEEAAEMAQLQKELGQ